MWGIHGLKNFTAVTKPAGGLVILRWKKVRRTVLVFKKQVEGQPVCNFVYLEKRREETRRTYNFVCVQKISKDTEKLWRMTGRLGRFYLFKF